MAIVTNNMRLEHIDPSDYVSPDVINSNFDKVDKLGVDYVVESGKSGEWWYRKWKSGRLEQGVDSKAFDKSDLHVMGGAASGQIYATKKYSFGAYPFAFAYRPHVHISFIHDTSRNVRGSWCILFNNDSATTTSPDFEVVDAGSDPMTPICSIYVCGTIKS